MITTINHRNYIDRVEIVPKVIETEIETNPSYNMLLYRSLMVMFKSKQYSIEKTIAIK
jgi:hypothetical protein